MPRSSRILLLLWVSLLAAPIRSSGQFVPPPVVCTGSEPPQRESPAEIGAFFESAALLTTSAGGPLPALADSKDAVWSAVAGAGRIESSVYAGRNGTRAANLYLYLYKVVSLGGNVEVPGLNIPLSGASLDFTLFRGRFVEVSSNAADAGDLPGFPDSEEQESFRNAAVVEDFAVLAGDHTGVFRSSAPVGFVSNRPPALGYGLMAGTPSFGSRVVAAVVPSREPGSAPDIAKVQERAAAAFNTAQLLMSTAAGGDWAAFRRAPSLAASTSEILQDANRLSAGAPQRDLQYLEMRLIDENGNFELLASRLASTLSDTPSATQTAILVIRGRLTLTDANRLRFYAAPLAQAQTFAGQMASTIAALETIIADLTQLHAELLRMNPPSEEQIARFTRLRSMLNALSLQVRTGYVQLAAIGDQLLMSGVLERLPQGFPSLIVCLTIPPVPPAVAAQSSLSWSLPGNAGLAFSASEGPVLPIPGFARIQSGSGGAPAALQFLTSKRRGVVISEAAIPAMPPVRFGRIPAFVDRNVNTGVAITNSSNSPVSVTFTLTQADGTVAGNTGVTINPNRHVVAFISDRFFGAGNSFDGTLTWRASAPLSVVALRGRTNERSEFLMSVLPIADLGNPSDLAAIVPHFADGGGWTTELKLANPADAPIRGALEFWSGGQPVERMTYSIAPAGVQTIRRSRSGLALQTGYIRILPGLASTRPLASASISFQKDGVTRSEHTFTAAGAGTAFRVFAEGAYVAGSTGSLRSGVIITNASSSPATVQLELLTLAGIPSGYRSTRIIPPDGQLASFLDEIAGLDQIPDSYQGVLVMTSDLPVVAAAFRARTDSYVEFLMTSVPVVSGAAPAPPSELILPQLVIGGGYGMEFVLFNRSAAEAVSGTFRSFLLNGEAAPLGLR